MGSDTYPDVVEGSWVLIIRLCHGCEILETYSQVMSKQCMKTSRLRIHRPPSHTEQSIVKTSWMLVRRTADSSIEINVVKSHSLGSILTSTTIRPSPYPRPLLQRRDHLSHV
jgi:hypothetical protein